MFMFRTVKPRKRFYVACTNTGEVHIIRLRHALQTKDIQHTHVWITKAFRTWIEAFDYCAKFYQV